MTLVSSTSKIHSTKASQGPSCGGHGRMGAAWMPGTTPSLRGPGNVEPTVHKREGRKPGTRHPGGSPEEVALASPARPASGIPSSVCVDDPAARQSGPSVPVPSRGSRPCQGLCELHTRQDRPQNLFQAFRNFIPNPAWGPSELGGSHLHAVQSVALGAPNTPHVRPGTAVHPLVRWRPAALSGVPSGRLCDP